MNFLRHTTEKRVGYAVKAGAQIGNSPSVSWQSRLLGRVRLCRHQAERCLPVLSGEGRQDHRPITTAVAERPPVWSGAFPSPNQPHKPRKEGGPFPTKMLVAPKSVHLNNHAIIMFLRYFSHYQEHFPILIKYTHFAKSVLMTEPESHVWMFNNVTIPYRWAFSTFPIFFPTLITCTHTLNYYASVFSRNGISFSTFF